MKYLPGVGRAGGWIKLGHSFWCFSSDYVVFAIKKIVDSQIYRDITPCRFSLIAARS